jgi:ACT domain-containing protein
MNEKIKKQTNKSSYIIELDAFKDGIKNGLTSKEIIEEFKKQNINNP